MSRIHVYEIPDDCDMTLRDGCVALTEKFGSVIHPRASISLESWEKINRSDTTEYIGIACKTIRAEHGEIPKHDIYGAMACPACGKVLRYSVSSYNGHIHGMCETDGCLCWMQ